MPMLGELDISRHGTTSLRYSLDLDHFRLERIEELRAGGDVNLRLELGTTWNQKEQPSTSVTQHQTPKIRQKIAKSDWIEQFLATMGYRRVRFVEVSEIETPEKWKKIVEHVHAAWKRYMTGDYNDVLTECRKAIELVSRCVLEAGFEKQIDGERRKVPNWDDLLGKSIGKEIAQIEKILRSFCAKGPHAGRNASRHEAEHVMMATQGFIAHILGVLSRSGRKRAEG